MRKNGNDRFEILARCKERRESFAFVILLLALTLSSKSQGGIAQETKHSVSTSSIAGHVTIQGKPAPGVEMVLLPFQHHLRDKAVAAAKTDENGRYRFTNLPSSHYWLKALMPEHVSANETYFGPGRKVSVADGESVENADIDLIPGGSISGRVIDLDGNPVTGEPVLLSNVDEQGQHDTKVYLRSGPFKTDKDGAFRIYGIPPDRYLVSVGVDIARLTGQIWSKYDFVGHFGRVSGDHYYEQTFYPGVTDRHQAHSINISPGEEVAEINIAVGRAIRTYEASGRVIDAQTGKGVSNCRLQVSQRVGQGYRGAMAADLKEDRTDENGYFRISGLIPGRFFIAASFSDDKTDLYSDKTDFEIKDEEVSGLEIRAYRGITIEGKVVLDEDNKDAISKIGQLQLQARLNNKGEEQVDIFRRSSVESDGRFKISGLRGGEIVMDTYPSSASRYLSIVRIEYPNPEDKDQTEIVLADPFGECHLRIGDKDLKGARIVLGYNNASIKSHVKIVGGSLPEHTRLMARVSYSKGNGSTGSMLEVDANGTFIMDGLEPGDYQISICDGIRDFTETRTVKVKKNARTEVSFIIDASAIKEND